MQAYNEEGKYKEAVESGERFLELKNPDWLYETDKIKTYYQIGKMHLLSMITKKPATTYQKYYQF